MDWVPDDDPRSFHFSLRAERTEDVTYEDDVVDWDCGGLVDASEMSPERE